MSGFIPQKDTQRDSFRVAGSPNAELLFDTTCKWYLLARNYLDIFAAITHVLPKFHRFLAMPLVPNKNRTWNMAPGIMGGWLRSSLCSMYAGPYECWMRKKAAEINKSNQCAQVSDLFTIAAAPRVQICEWKNGSVVPHSRSIYQLIDFPHNGVPAAGRSGFSSVPQCVLFTANKFIGPDARQGL